MSTTQDENSTAQTNRLASASYIGGRDLTDRAGLSLIAMEQLAKIYSQQFTWLIEDQQTSWRKLGETMNPISVWMDHLGRRGRHIGQGVEQLFETVQEISTRNGTLARDLTDAYSNVVQMSPSKTSSPPARSHEDILARLHLDHKRLHRILVVIENLVDKIETLQPAELDRLVCCVDYIAEYPDTVHHPLEDRLFNHLLGLELSEEARNQIESNAAKHEELTAATQRLADDINALLEDRGRTPLELKPDALEYIDMQRRHMAFEEKYVFSLAQEHLKARPWHELEGEDTPTNDPLFDQQSDRFDAIYQYVSGRL